MTTDERRSRQPPLRTLSSPRSPARLELMSVSEETIRKLLTRKKLRRYKFGNRTLVNVAELRSLVREIK